MFPKEFPYPASAFKREDETVDGRFYSFPRFVTHIDDAAISAVSTFYAKAVLPSSHSHGAVLDLCSSWISHYPPKFSLDRVVGLGMNAEELGRNKVLTEFVVQDLNTKPSLPFETASFDAVTNTVSVDYLTQPLEVFRETLRVLKPGGIAAMTFSNRCFPTKAVKMWLDAKTDQERVLIVASYFHYAGFTDVDARDITGLTREKESEETQGGCASAGSVVDKLGRWLDSGSDPVFVVFGFKPALDKGDKLAADDEAKSAE